MRQASGARADLLPLAAAAIVALLSLIPLALAQSAPPSSSGPPLSTGFKFGEQSGEALYANVCQDCHMSDGKGASGAGTYPSIAADEALATGGYPVFVVVNGQRAMPPFGAMMSDEQVAAVVNFVRTHFGNNYQDAASAADVKAVRR